MESNCNIVENNNSHKVFIKEEPWTPDERTVAVKVEEPSVSCISQNESVYVVAEGETEPKSDTNAESSEMHFKIEIKEEAQWLETPSTEISCKSENYSHSDADLQSKNKENASDVGEIAAGDDSRLHTETLCRDSNSDCCSFTCPNLEENSNETSNHNSFEAFQFLKSRQTQMRGETGASYTFDSNAEACSSVQNCNVPNSSEICKSSIKFLSELKNSIRKVHQKVCNCKTCENFTHTPDFNHQVLIHQDKYSRYPDSWKKTLIQSSNLKQYSLTHEDKRIHICEICNKRFNVASNLRKHKLIHEGKRPHTCETCNKSFTQSSSLNRHKLIHEGKRPHICEICKKSFTQPSILKEHKLTHTNIRQYKCEICDKSFIRLSNLREHKLIHAGKRQYSCEICRKSFTHSSTLKHHLLIHEDRRPHTCEICNKSFKQITTLKDHKLTHTGIKHYKCKICDKKFTQASILRRHVLIHEGKREHTCGICNKSFLLSSHLKRHKSVHEESRSYSMKF